MKCAQCSEDIKDGQEVQRIPALSVARSGKKSGQITLYEKDPREDGSPNEEDIVHVPWCLIAFFNPEHNADVEEKLLDSCRDQIEEEVRQEVRDEMDERFEQIRRSTPTDRHRYCMGCWDELEGEIEEEEMEYHHEVIRGRY